MLCKQPDGKTEYEGWCWTGSSSWVDYFDPKSWAWWAGLFKLDKFQVRFVRNTCKRRDLMLVGRAPRSMFTTGSASSRLWPPCALC